MNGFWAVYIPLYEVKKFECRKSLNDMEFEDQMAQEGIITTQSTPTKKTADPFPKDDSPIGDLCSVQPAAVTFCV